MTVSFEQRRRELREVGDRVRRLERRDDALRLAEQPEAFERLRVRDGDVLGAAGVLVEAVLGADAGVVEARRDAVRLLHLARTRPAAGTTSSRGGRPGVPFESVAAWRSVSTPSPAASTPMNFTPASSTNGWKSPIALLPPPTQAIA